MKFDQVDVRFLRKDVAIAHVSWELLGDARTQSPRRGVFLFVLTRQNPEWLIEAAAVASRTLPTVSTGQVRYMVRIMSSISERFL
jgi:hypothetical protein